MMIRKTRHTYRVIKVEREPWPVYYELAPGVEPAEIETVEDAEAQAQYVYDYYAWISGAEVVCDVVKVIADEH